MTDPTFELTIKLTITAQTLGEAVTEVENRLKYSEKTGEPRVRLEEVSGRLVPARAGGKITRTGLTG